MGGSSLATAASAGSEALRARGASLKPSPARSYTHTRVESESAETTLGWIVVSLSFPWHAALFSQSSQRFVMAWLGSSSEVSANQPGVDPKKLSLKPHAQLDE